MAVDGLSGRPMYNSVSLECVPPFPICLLFGVVYLLYSKIVEMAARFTSFSVAEAVQTAVVHRLSGNQGT